MQVLPIFRMSIPPAQTQSPPTEKQSTLVDNFPATVGLVTVIFVIETICFL